MSTHDADTIVIGAGLAGLQCARTLHRSGQRVLLLEAADAVGGRVRTDIYEGFRLDRGFQVFIDAYPATRENLDYLSLDLRAFTSGALVWHAGAFHKISDPWKHPDQLFATLCAPLGSFGDKVKIASLRASTTRLSLEEIFAKPETTTLLNLQKRGFSSRFIDGFFRPFLGGIFLENQLDTSSRFFEFVFKMFSEGKTVVPAKGMQEIPNQLASTLPPEIIRLNAPVESAQNGVVKLKSGESFSAPNIVLATDADAAARLQNNEGRSTLIAWHATACVYFAAEKSPVSAPTLVLNGSGEGPINNLAVMTDVAPEYSASGEALISVSVLGDPRESDEQLAANIQAQSQQWYGNSVNDWRLLKVQRVRRALPVLPSIPSQAKRFSNSDIGWLCGDFQATPSIQGAMESGTNVAQAILKNAG